jgi:hypothetical protein
MPEPAGVVCAGEGGWGAEGCPIPPQYEGQGPCLLARNEIDDFRSIVARVGTSIDPRDFDTS